MNKHKVVEVHNIGCDYCEFKGYVYVPNGKDDVDADPCPYCVLDGIVKEAL